MYKLLIVDDELMIREGLKDCIPWDSYNIEVVGTAGDGETGLALAQSTLPDIVLTDVRMPFMDGITFAHKLREQHENIQIVFVSGYDDMDYMKSALQVEAVDYIMKPVNRNELSNVIEKITHKLLAANSKQALLQQMNVKLRQSMPLLRERFLMTLIHDDLISQVDLDVKAQMLDMNLPFSGLYCVVLVSLDNQAQFYEDMSEYNKQLYSFAILNICQELIERTHHGYAFERLQGEFVCLLYLTSEQEEALFELVTLMQESLASLLKISVTIGVGRAVSQLGMVSQSYKMAFSAVNQKLFLGQNRILTFDNLETGKNHIFRLTPQHTEQFTHLLRAGDDAKLSEWLQQLFEALTATRPTLMQCRNMCMMLLLVEANLSIELELNKPVTLTEQQLWEKLDQLETIPDMCVLLNQHFKTVCNLIQQKRTGNSKRVTEEIKSYLAEHFHEGVTINILADHVYMTSTYICLLFKQETGETINDYLTRIRMNKAKELIRDYSYKLQDIGPAVGYQDPSYFTKQFKKHVGITPSGYREQVH